MNDKKLMSAYCPICDEERIMFLRDTISHCPKCNHHLTLHPVIDANWCCIRVWESDNFIVEYDRSRGMYKVSIFEGDCFKNEFWFDAFRELEVEEMNLVYGHITDGDTWVEGIFDNREQALAFAEYLNLTEKNPNWKYYAGNGSWTFNKLDYVEEVKKLKANYKN